MLHTRISALVLVLASVAACSSSATRGDNQSADVIADADHDLDLLTAPRDIIKAAYDEQIRHSPISAMYAGEHGFDAAVDDLSPEEAAKFYRRMDKLGTKLATIDVSKLTPTEELAYDIATASVDNAHGRKVAATDLWEINSIWDVADVPQDFAYIEVMTTAQDVDNLVARYHQIPRYLDQRTKNFKAGLAQHLVAARPVIERGIANTKKSAVAVKDGSPFSALTFGDAVSDADKAAWQARVDAIVDAEIVPAYVAYAAFLENEVLPQGRTTTFGLVGLGSGSEGLDYYTSQVAFQTGSKQTPQQLHDLGLARVTELDTKMRAELSTVGIDEPTLVAGLEKLKALPESTGNLTVQEISDYAKEFLKKLDAPEWAAARWGVAGAPAPTCDVKDEVGTAYYTIGSNTMTVFAKGTTKQGLDSQLSHEFTHYLQDVVAHEKADDASVSPYVSLFGGSALTEGTAHYAETLALDSNLYTQTVAKDTALRRIEAMSLLMLRAVRLVVDTGIHAFGLKRDEAIQYMQERVSWTADDIAFEVDRYASYPAQALGYRVGMEGIASERARAEQALGTKFSEKDYNHLVLGLTGGSLQTLTHRVDQFIAANAAK